ncbi:MAG: MotA/TolQ/ExbB proton channel family protein [Chitinophagaceae bacterium]|nr:MotA/TolQ/ExbB proton channel family protein [Chitinophagaceae bacterium]
MIKKGSSSGLFPVLVIITCLVIAVVIYQFILGNPSNFVDAERETPKAGNIQGIMFKGGFLVPVILTMLLMVVVFTIERLLTLSKANGSGNLSNFVRKVQFNLANDNIADAVKECDRQKGSVANVIKSGLKMYSEMENDRDLSKEQKLLAIQKEIEEATSLELPMLQKNLPFIATIAPLGTLGGLIGTVLGMIRAFAAMGQSGAADSVALSVGISEALVNTATGIITSALAIIAYNYFSNRIDSLTYLIDEAGYSITNTFASRHK